MSQQMIEVVHRYMRGFYARQERAQLITEYRALFVAELAGNR